MKKLREKLAELGVLEAFDANFAKSNENYGIDEESVESSLSTKASNGNKLMASFIWGESPEGFIFWLDVYNKLDNFDKLEA